MTTPTFLQRVRGTARLDVRAFQEVKLSASAGPQALVVVAAASIATAVGGNGTRTLVEMALAVAIAALVWSVWAVIAWVVGTRLMPDPRTEATLPQLLRPLAFAAAPAVGASLAAIPLLGGVFAGIACLWAALATTVAIRHTLHYPSTARALGAFLMATAIAVAVVMGLRAFLD